MKCPECRELGHDTEMDLAWDDLDMRGVWWKCLKCGHSSKTYQSGGPIDSSGTEAA